MLLDFHITKFSVTGIFIFRCIIHSFLFVDYEHLLRLITQD